MVRDRGVTPDAAEVERLRALYGARVRLELDLTEDREPAARVRWSGDPLARVVFVKGVPSAADVEAGRAFAGADGDAARKAAAALGLDAGGVLFTCSRPAGDERSSAARLVAQIEAADPDVVIAADAAAAEDVATALGAGRLVAGVPISALGRSVVAVDGFEESLGDEDRKRLIWSQMRSVAAARD